MNALTYILQFNVFAILFYGFYLVFLQKETFHQANRLFLLGSLLISLCVPVLTSDWLASLFVSEAVEDNIQVYYFNALAATVVSSKNEGISLYQLLAIIYGIGVVLFFIKFMFSIQTLRKILQKGTQAFCAFTFGRKTYIDSNLPEYASIATHEQVHARQLHSADIIFMELLLVLNWFNPVLYFYEKAIKNIHEFLADEEAAKQLGPVAYAKLLLSQEFGVNPSVFINLFYEKATLKQRITMLAKPKSRKSAILKYGLALPIFLGMLIVSSAFVTNKNSFINSKSTKAKELVDLILKEEINITVPIKTIFSKKEKSKNKKNIALINDLGFEKKASHIVIDTIQPVAFNTEFSDENEYKIDGVVVSTEIMKSINPDRIKNLSITKNPTDLNGKKLVVDITLIEKSKPRYNFSNIKTNPEGKGFILQEEEIHEGSIDIQAQFKGGTKAMYKYLAESIVYPKPAQLAGVQGMVFVKFVVKKDGSIGDVEVQKGIGFGCDVEAIRVVKAMPIWRPAKHKGKNVPIYFNMPISFLLK
jgi:TonB family protein